MNEKQACASYILERCGFANASEVSRVAGQFGRIVAKMNIDYEFIQFCRKNDIEIPMR